MCSLRRRPIRVVFVSLYLCAPALAAPDYWDPRLDQICGLYLDDKAATVPAGNGYWRLTRGEFENEQQSGGNHHIYCKCLDVNGNPIENQEFWASWPYTSESNFSYQFTKGSVDSYWGNYPMYVGTCAGTALFGANKPGPWPFNAYVDTTNGPSDKVYGMGMTSPQGTGCGAHVNFRLTWRWTISSPPQPLVDRAPASFTRMVSRGTNPTSDLFTIHNAGGGTLNYSIDPGATWLSGTPNSGSLTGVAVDTITLLYATASLDIGTYTADVVISGNATNSPQAIHVTLTVHAPAYRGDFNGDGDVDQEDFGHLQVCLTAPAVTAEPACTDARLDDDLDVDQDDLDLFILCMSGPQSSPGPQCLR